MAAKKSWRLRPVDAAVVVLLLLVACYGIGFDALGEPRLSAPDFIEYALGVVATAPLLLWWRFPVAAFGLVASAAAASLALGYGFGPVMFQLMLATTMLIWKVRGWPLSCVGIGYGVVLIGAFALRFALLANDPAAFVLRWATAAILWLVLPVVVGVALRVQQETKARIRAERASRAAAEEQLRIAQELHDIVGHGLAVIAMQASAGQHVLERDPRRAGQALTAIQDTARAALDGLRAEVANLHAEHPMTADGAGIWDLPRLVDRIRDGGVPVVLDIDPRLESRFVPVDTDRAVYRIAQEALTNVLRHGGPRTTARVEIRSTGADLVVEVTNTDPGQSDTAPVAPEVVAGVGIRGMRRRAHLLGGQIETGRRPGGGFRVIARLPLPASVPAHLS